MLFSKGFAANNISEAYDAKIFSVATLLSSYLIYNSVKVRTIVFYLMIVINFFYFIDN